MSDHAVLSPSKAHRWMVCPGSIRAESAYPEEPSGPSAIDGTHSHTLLEKCIKSMNIGLPCDPMVFVTHRLTDHEGAFNVDADRAERVKVAMDYILANRGTGIVLPEGRVDPEYLVGRKGLDGTCDVQIRGDEVLELIDYKDGMKPVAAENNPQLKQYALGVLASYKIPVNQPYPFKRVRMTIVQPKLRLKGLEPISSWEVPIKTALSWIGEFASAASNTERADAPLVAGEHCTYCRARGGCSARVDAAQASLGTMFGDVTKIDAPTELANKSADSMDNEKLRELIESAPMIRKLLDDAEEEALKRMQAGQPIAGLKVVRGRGSRGWSRPEDEMADKLKRMGVPKDALYVTKLVSPAQAEKLSWEKRDGTKVSFTERQLNTLKKEYIVTSQGKLTVAPESDPRESVIQNAAPMFAAVVKDEPQAPAESLPSWLS